MLVMSVRREEIGLGVVAARPAVIVAGVASAVASVVGVGAAAAG